MVLPLLHKKADGKDLILKILTGKHLTVKGLHKEMVAKYNYRATYHAVYQLVKDLSSNGVVIREGDAYHINPLWVEDVYRFLQSINGEEKFAVEHKKVKILSFETLEMADSYLKSFEKTFLNEAKRKDKIICWHSNHSWWDLAYSKDTLITLKELKRRKVKIYAVTEGDTITDRWIASLYQRYGMFAKTGVPNNFSVVIGIYGPNIVLMIWPQEVVEKMDSLYKSVRNIQNLNMHDFFENVLTKKLNTPVKLVIYENKKEAKRIANLMISYFK